MDYLSQNLIAFAALSISILTYLGARRSVGRYATANSVNSKIAQLEAEILKLHTLLDRCIKERVGFKDRIINLEKALKAANIELKEMNNVEPESTTPDF